MKSIANGYFAISAVLVVAIALMVSLGGAQGQVPWALVSIFGLQLAIFVPLALRYRRKARDEGKQADDT